jgi:hypothetical protein
MIPLDLEKHPTLTESLLQLAVAEYVQWWRVVCIPNLRLWHEMDVAVLTRAGCLWEFEIKLTQADWERDREKDALPAGVTHSRYARPRRNLAYVDRFYYVHAMGLSCPDWVPAWVGLLEAEQFTSGGKVYLRLVEHRAAKRRRAPKPEEHHRDAIYRAAYYRYWSGLKRLPLDEQLIATQDNFSGAA